MNAKKCKAIRQLLKLEGVDVKETAYVGTSARDKFGRNADQTSQRCALPTQIVRPSRLQERQARSLNNQRHVSTDVNCPILSMRAHRR